HSTGTAAVEAALLFARQHFQLAGQPRRNRFIAIERSYHGASLLGAAVSHDPDCSRWLEPLPSGVVHLPTPDGVSGEAASLQTLRDVLAREGAETFAALIVEPVIVTAGMVVPPDAWMREARELCRQHGILFVADEVI